MGKRINVVISGLCLFSNSHHPAVDAEQIVKDLAKTANGPTQLLENLLTVLYPSNHGTHSMGDRVFTIDYEPGDYEKIIHIDRYLNVKEMQEVYKINPADDYDHMYIRLDYGNTYNSEFKPFNREYTYKVESYAVLDEIIQTVPCYTRESSRSQIVDLDDLEAEDVEALAKILGIDSKGIPNGGIIVFYK